MANADPLDAVTPAPAPDHSPLSPRAAVRPSWFRRTWRVAKTTAAVLFVSWQLFFLFVRNPLDFWYDEIKGWCKHQRIWDGGVKPVLDPVDDATRHYGNFAGIDQNWKMFAPPLARYAYFLAARIQFTDGSEDLILSENEPDPGAYFRFGGWRQRKLEDYLVLNQDEIRPGHEELPLWEAYARWSLRRWAERRPDDPRTPKYVVLLRRDINFPKPTENPAAFEQPDVYTLATFLPDGSLAP